MSELAPYTKTVGPTRSFAHAMDQTQTVDPLRIGLAIEAAFATDRTLLRLQVGGDAIDLVRRHAEQLLADLAAWDTVGRAIDFE